MQAGQSKLATMFARAWWTAAKPAGASCQRRASGLTKTNLQISGPSHGGQAIAMERFYKFSWRFLPFMWQEIDEGILPALYAAASPGAEGEAFYGPRGIGELAGGGVQKPRTRSVHRRRPTTGGSGSVSEQLTGVTYPKPN